MADSDRDQVLENYRAVIARFPEVEEKGKKMPYTSLNGHMTSFVSPDGQLCIRLSKADMAEFLATFPGDPVTQYGAVMKEYVVVPAALQQDIDGLADWFRRSRAYVGGLKPKPTKRR